MATADAAKAAARDAAAADDSVSIVAAAGSAVNKVRSGCFCSAINIGLQPALGIDTITTLVITAASHGKRDGRKKSELDLT
jgi:hypothetical protein